MLVIGITTTDGGAIAAETTVADGAAASTVQPEAIDSTPDSDGTQPPMPPAESPEPESTVCFSRSAHTNYSPTHCIIIAYT